MGMVSELKRRNVLRMAALYVVAAWLIMQVAGVLIDLGALPEWSGPWVLAVLAIGFPIALIFSWFYEITPEGVALEKDVAPGDVAAHVGGRRIDFVIIAILAAAVVLFAYDKWWPEGPMEQSIAVLAFENLSGDPEQEYFSDGISEEILNLLAQIKPLKVIARTSSFSFKDKGIDIPTMAAQMNVSHILDGSVRRSGNRMRITVQLIDSSDSTHIWSQTYDREFGDVFAIQDEIAAAIADSLKLQLELVAGEPLLPHALEAANVDAYDAYLKGRALFRRRGNENVRAAIGEFERALRLDDNFAPAHAQLALATAFLGLGGNLSLEEINHIAIPHIERAEALAPNLADVHAARAILANVEGDFEAEIVHAQNALDLNPNYGDAMNSLQIALLMLGRYEEQEVVLEQMLTMDPLDGVVRFNYAEMLCMNGRIDEARVLADQVLAQDPRWGHWIHANISMNFDIDLADALDHALRVPNRWWATRILTYVGEYDEARRMLPAMSHWVDADRGDWDNAVRFMQDQLETAPDNVEILANAGGTLVLANRIRDALPLLERAFDRSPQGRPIAVLDGGARATMWLAEVRRHTGDEHGAQIAAQIARHDLAARRTAGMEYVDLRLEEAMLAAFDNDFDRTIQSLERAIDLGLRDPSLHFTAVSFSRFRNEPRFVQLLERLERLVAGEHAEILQLICFNNPTPDDWQPLPETCEGVVERRSH